jgi:DNA invertase Pin-like site-specific DNA recombinase
MVRRQKRVALYLRVSTDGQTVENQRRELLAAAERHGWLVVEAFEDQGVSGAKSRTERPAMNRLLQGVSRREFDMVAAWKLDRLGRSLEDLIGFLKTIKDKGVDLYIHDIGGDGGALDTSTAAGKMMFHVMGAFAEFERSMIQERVIAGMSRAQAAGKFGKNRRGEEKRNKGRPPIDDRTRAAIVKARSKGESLRAIAKAFQISKSAVGLIVADAR